MNAGGTARLATIVRRLILLDVAYTLHRYPGTRQKFALAWADAVSLRGTEYGLQRVIDTGVDRALRRLARSLRESPCICYCGMAPRATYPRGIRALCPECQRRVLAVRLCPRCDRPMLPYQRVLLAPVICFWCEACVVHGLTVSLLHSPQVHA